MSLIDRLQSWLSLFFFAAAVCLFAAAAYLHFAPAAGPALEAGDTDIEISDCIAGRKQTVALRLHNKSAYPIRVVGLAKC